MIGSQNDLNWQKIRGNDCKRRIMGSLCFQQYLAVFDAIKVCVLQSNHLHWILHFFNVSYGKGT